MREEIPDATLDEVNKLVHGSRHISVAIDADLNYIAVNEAACKMLKITPDDMLGKNALDMFPEIIASKNHRNMMRALSGEIILDDMVESRTGILVATSYLPIKSGNKVRAVVLIGKTPEV